MAPPASTDKPNSVAWPPILLVSGLVGMRVARDVIPLPLALPFSMQAAGWAVIAAAVLIDFWVFALFRQRGTNIRPDRPASSLVTSGPFRFSRNPIYVGNVMILLGAGMVMSTFWGMGMALGFFILMDRMVIPREEAHLRATFDEAWDDYASKVRRWL